MYLASISSVFTMLPVIFSDLYDVKPHKLVPKFTRSILSLVLKNICFFENPSFFSVLYMHIHGKSEICMFFF
jgi:hypothetical protein